MKLKYHQDYKKGWLTGWITIKSSIIYLNQIKAEPKKEGTMSALPTKYRGNTPEVGNMSTSHYAHNLW
ncbi:MAG: hypothetical protein RSB26_03670 [Lachnospiraceae bacterium]